MSYAEVTSHNSTQSPEEARANPVPEVEHSTETSTISLVDVDSPHVSVVPSDFSTQDVKTSTQADRIEREAEAAKAKAKAAASKAKAKGRQEKEWLIKNKEHPVVIGNAVLSAVLLGVVGYGAWAKYRVGELGWKVFGLGAVALGAFGVADFYASKFLFQKYPDNK